MQTKKRVLIISVTVIAIIVIVLGVFLGTREHEYLTDTELQNIEVRDEIKQALDKEGDVTVEYGEGGMVQNIDAGFLKEMPDDTELTQFDIDMLHEYVYVLEGESIENVLKLSEKDIYFEAARGLLNKIYIDNGYSSFEIIDVTQDIDIETQEAYYIVKYRYDYWSITYYPGKGATGFQDKTGMLAEIYGEHEEDIEWDD